MSTASEDEMLDVIRRIIEEEPRYQSGGPTYANGNDRAAKPPEPARYAGSLDEWDAGDDPGAIPPRHWLLGNQFCRSFISSIVAAGGTGKTALRMLQFIAMALGRDLSGQKSSGAAASCSSVWKTIATSCNAVSKRCCVSTVLIASS